MLGLNTYPHYNGTLGTCTRCRQANKQLESGLCRACRQQAERERPRRVLDYRVCANAGCNGQAAPGSQFCAACNERRRVARQAAYNEKRRWARRVR